MLAAAPTPQRYAQLSLSLAVYQSYDIFSAWIDHGCAFSFEKFLKSY